MSALYNSPEAYLITYNLAYCYFMERDYTNALKWFDKYLDEAHVEYRKDALERKGDCWFVAKKYKNAASSYALSVNDYFDVNDVYPYYQAAMSYGLSGDRDRKVELLENVRNAQVGVPYYSEALYELGRCYIGAKQDDKAYECFELLSTNQKDGNYMAKAYLEMGSIERNRNDYDAALEHYRVVVEQLPMSGYEEDALLAIENIYRAKNQSEQYVAYIENIGKGASKTEEEKEDLVFSSAEQVFLSDNYQKALTALKSYMEKYPNGRNRYKANFYMAESYRALDMKEQACDCYEIVIGGGQSAFVEVSMLNYASLSYKLERWDDAFGGYKALCESAKMDENRFLAKLGMMRSAFRGRSYDKALMYAQTLAEDHRADDGLKLEASYVQAKSYMAQSHRDEALAIWRTLSADTSTAYGAEAAYMLILDAYDRGDFQDVENKVYAFSDSASGQMYWLAKSFVVLGDSFADRGELKQAKATFESIKEGYAGNADGDDVLEGVELRLQKLDALMNKN
jgi:tetratricopeptide (TPR) repeat protein